MLRVSGRREQPDPDNRNQKTCSNRSLGSHRRDLSTCPSLSGASTPEEDPHRLQNSADIGEAYCRPPPSKRPPEAPYSTASRGLGSFLPFHSSPCRPSDPS